MSPSLPDSPCRPLCVPLRSPFFKMHIRLSKRLKKGIRQSVGGGVFQSVHSLCLGSLGCGWRDALFIADRRRGAQLLCRNSSLAKKGGICLCRRLPCRPTVFCLLTRSVGRFSVAQINARRNMNGSELIFLSGVPLGGPKNIPSLIDVFNLLVSPVDTSEIDYGRSNARLCRFSP